jgi:hypothetical protein
MQGANPFRLGQYRGGADTLEQQRLMLTTDSHPVSKYRVIGPLSITPEFQQAFACKAGSPMFKPPALPGLVGLAVPRRGWHTS